MKYWVLTPFKIGIWAQGQMDAGTVRQTVLTACIPNGQIGRGLRVTRRTIHTPTNIYDINRVISLWGICVYLWISAIKYEFIIFHLHISCPYKHTISWQQMNMWFYNRNMHNHVVRQWIMWLLKCDNNVDSTGYRIYGRVLLLCYKHTVLWGTEVPSMWKHTNICTELKPTINHCTYFMPVGMPHIDGILPKGPYPPCLRRSGPFSRIPSIYRAPIYYFCERGV